MPILVFAKQTLRHLDIELYNIQYAICLCINFFTYVPRHK